MNDTKEGIKHWESAGDAYEERGDGAEENTEAAKHYLDAANAYGKAAELAERLLGQAHQNTLNLRDKRATSLGEWACRLLNAGRGDPTQFKHAIDYGLETLERIADPKNKFALKIQRRLGEHYLGAGMIHKAIGIYEDIVKKLESTNRAAPKRLYKDRNNLAEALYRSGTKNNKMRAAELNFQTLRFLEEVVGKDSLDVVKSRYNLGRELLDLGKFGDAIERFEDNISILGKDDAGSKDGSNHMIYLELSIKAAAKCKRRLEKQTTAEANMQRSPDAPHDRPAASSPGKCRTDNAQAHGTQDAQHSMNGIPSTLGDVENESHTQATVPSLQPFETLSHVIPDQKHPPSELDNIRVSQGYLEMIDPGERRYTERPRDHQKTSHSGSESRRSLDVDIQPLRSTDGLESASWHRTSLPRYQRTNLQESDHGSDPNGSSTPDVAPASPRLLFSASCPHSRSAADLIRSRSVNDLQTAKKRGKYGSPPRRKSVELPQHSRPRIESPEKSVCPQDAPQKYRGNIISTRERSHYPAGPIPVIDVSLVEIIQAPPGASMAPSAISSRPELCMDTVVPECGPDISNQGSMVLAPKEEPSQSGLTSNRAHDVVPKTPKTLGVVQIAEPGDALSDDDSTVQINLSTGVPTKATEMKDGIPGSERLLLDEKPGPNPYEPVETMNMTANGAELSSVDVYLLGGWKTEFDDPEKLHPKQPPLAKSKSVEEINARGGHGGTVGQQPRSASLDPPVSRRPIPVNTVKHHIDAHAAAAADNWFEELKESHRLLDKYRDFETDAKKRKRVKIAILDTGIAKSRKLEYGGMPKLVANNRARIKPGKRLKNDLPWDEDEDGHGTHAAGLILKVCPYAHVFIYRVVRDHEQDISTQIVKEALLDAVDEKKVDIISMSFGWEQNSDEELSSAIEHARSARVLMFAASSNYGNRKRVALTYPARADEVFAIDSSDGNGTPASYNPPQDWEDRFTALGEEVESAFPHHLVAEGETMGLKRLRGTSCATPIAAAIAGLVLEFARQPPLSFEDKIEKQLKKKDGMREVLRHQFSRKANGTSHLLDLNPTILFRCDDHHELYRDGGEWHDGSSRCPRQRAWSKILHTLHDHYDAKLGSDLDLRIEEERVRRRIQG